MRDYPKDQESMTANFSSEMTHVMMPPYTLDEETGLISTTDFFMPVVDDPFAFGQVAATNAISDVMRWGPTWRLESVGPSRYLLLK